MSERELAAYLTDVRALVLEEIRRIVPSGSDESSILYDLMLDYPLRAAKTLRPALCLATCRALGGQLHAALPTAAVLELYHNAFLIHDDIEDGSEKRRDRPTLHESWGIPIAINVGDAMLALALTPLLDNMRTVGLGQALQIMQAIAVMARESAEGQALELAWVREARYEESDAAYERMVEKKTGFYSFVTPMAVGAMLAGHEAPRLLQLERFARLLGVAFQIQDDVLNLAADEVRYGKEIAGDLWEGKLTLILLHALRSATTLEREQAHRILKKARPDARSNRWLARVGELTQLTRTESPTAAHGLECPCCERVRGALQGLRDELTCLVKTADDVAFLADLIRRYESIAYARAIAVARARSAAALLEEMSPWLKPSVHRSFLEGLVEYVIQRDH